mmetsp:Transcript_44764/g.87765  ORF Transcript_44764/g.87765 Transcript_44764/m.87765 type:complete len:96 (+) Transcript_44764:206-493(+)
MMRYFNRNKRLCSFLLLACSTSVKGMDTGEIPTVTCVDDADFVKSRGGRDRTCAYIGGGDKQWRIDKWCKKQKQGVAISALCCETCKKCNTCNSV